VGKQRGKRLLRKPRCRWENNIELDRRELGLGSMDWINVGQDGDRWRAFVNRVMNLRVL
jgi:hypothetical protein